MCASQLSRWVKNPPAMQETHVWSLWCEDPLEEGMATHSSILFFFNINLFVLFGGLLLYNIVLVLPYINKNPPRVHTCSRSWSPLPPPSPYHPSRSSQCTSPEHLVSCIEPGLAISFTYDNIHISMPFSHIIPPSPSPTEAKRLFYTSVSFAVSHTGLSLLSF